MSAHRSNVLTIGEVNQRNASTYIDHGVSTTTTVVHDVGHYSKQSFQINAQAVYTHNGVHHSGAGSPNAALNDLYSKIAHAALHNASNRRDAPRCLEGTRTSVQDDIFRWIDGDAKSGSAQQGRILQLDGTIGCGKSAIMGTIADKLQKKGQLAAAFFFPSNTDSSEGLCDKHQFVITLAYQLIQHEGLQSMRHQVLSTLEKDPSVFKMHLREQLEVLILKPLRERAPHNQGNSPQLPRVILVDGVYECGPDPNLPNKSTSPYQSAIQQSIEQNKAEVLAVLQQAVDDPLFPFQIISSSRGSSRPMPGDSIISLSNERYDPNADIALFLRHHFAAIRRRHSYLLTGWPGEDDIQDLVRRASGLFIYIVTVVRFVERPPKPPQVRLNIVLGRAERTVVPTGASRALYTPSNLRREGPSASFSAPLDGLYERLIWSSSNPLLVVRWLKAFQQLSITRGTPTWFLHLVCESYEGEAELLFESASDLVRMSNPRDVDQAEYTFYHSTFQHFCSSYSERVGLAPDYEWKAQRMWLVGQFILAFRNKGPQVPLSSSVHLPIFCQTLIHYWVVLIRDRPPEGIQYYDEDLLSCDPDWWLPFADLTHEDGRDFTRLLYVVAHAQCERDRPCRPECTRWRDPIRKLWQDAGHMQIGSLTDPPEGPSIGFQRPRRAGLLQFFDNSALSEIPPSAISPSPQQRKPPLGSRLKVFVRRILRRASGLWRDLVRGEATTETGHIPI